MAAPPGVSHAHDASQCGNLPQQRDLGARGRDQGARPRL